MLSILEKWIYVVYLKTECTMLETKLKKVR
ncbi:hypothetical protein EG68_04615 [Paragonimus skrjabini miyazakii]|uniref:Uncharacterized protein n=1 Tax=Paragonimus skrjabini miyazakii TaxID=59628 RepID=A0A8S9YTI1_9TREM|nr:hypothetical protein EG68_04615 [Paragonimus skrjabini miyazakii]